jgi:short-subunit dehydrogenase
MPDDIHGSTDLPGGCGAAGVAGHAGRGDLLPGLRGARDAVARARYTRRMPTSYRSAFITGASSGLGRGLALWFARNGVQVYAAARRTERLVALREEAAQAGGRVEPVALDVTRTKDVLERVAEIDGACGGLDLVIANAGISEFTKATKLDYARVQRIIDTNVSGAAATICAALPKMVERNRGHVVGVSSLAALRGMARLAAYCGSKAFLSVFLEGLRVDLLGTGVKVTALLPGFVRTDINAGVKGRIPFMLQPDEAVERMAKAILRGDKEYAFPWPVAGAARAMRFLPNGLWDLATGGRGKRR